MTEQHRSSNLEHMFDSSTAVTPEAWDPGSSRVVCWAPVVHRGWLPRQCDRASVTASPSSALPMLAGRPLLNSSLGKTVAGHGLSHTRPRQGDHGLVGASSLELHLSGYR